MSARTGMIDDKDLIRGDVPFTKGEVRAVTIARLDIGPEHHILDIGAGTGTITLELARRLDGGLVTAVEKKEKACRLIRANLEKFDLDNVELIPGDAPGCLPNKKWDRIFIGGSGGNLAELIRYSKIHLREDGILVINTVTLNTLGEALPLLKEAGYLTDITMLQVSKIREVGQYSMYSGQNPIHIITAKKE